MSTKITHIENPKKRHIVEAAKELFWKFGIKRVSIEEICKEANVSKMTFYKHFKNKNELIKFILDFITGSAMEEYNEIMNRDIPYKEKVDLTIKLKMKSSDHMSSEFFRDFSQTATHELKDYYQKIAQKNLSVFMNDFIEAQKKGEIRKDLNPMFIIYFLNQMLEMTKDENLIAMYPHPQDLIMELTNFLFYGIMPRELKNK